MRKIVQDIFSSQSNGHKNVSKRDLGGSNVVSCGLFHTYHNLPRKKVPAHLFIAELFSDQEQKHIKGSLGGFGGLVVTAVGRWPRISGFESILYLF